MKKVFIVSIQGQKLITVDGHQNGQYENSSYIEAIDMNGNELDLKKFIFMQPKDSMFTEDEIENFKNLGLDCFYINPWDFKKNNPKAEEFLMKKGYYHSYRGENNTIISSTFDGWIIIGEIEAVKADELQLERSIEYIEDSIERKLLEAEKNGDSIEIDFTDHEISLFERYISSKYNYKKLNDYTLAIKGKIKD